MPRGNASGANAKYFGQGLPQIALDQAITYRLGKDRIYELRQEGAKRLGDRFSVKTFHVRFIRQGTIPPSYFGDALLNELQQAR